ncbi:MAG: D-3-phosphoglycerate dehydrogenase (phosphoglycerate dehydrogenase)-like protein [Betaproteobacteria bacterium]|nr:D-3-phosphoglycerate dehydrogenase (phosphoglycerate dehydrogenase)-like protein [Betaproteobacteria bacterium]
MTGILLSKGFVSTYGELLAATARRAGLALEIVHLPDDPAVRLPAADLDRIEMTMLTRDIRFSAHYQPYGDTLLAAKNLKLAYFDSTAIEQHPFVAPLAARGVRLTTAAGSNGVPVAQTVITTLLMMSRLLPQYLDAQHRKSWEPARAAAQPPDLQGQTIVIVGMGTIGATVARFAQVLGMHVIGVRRKPRADGDPVNEMHTLAELPQLLPRCDWLVLACPLVPETRGLINAQSLAAMKKTAGLINVARGALCDEAALIAALQQGRLRCAHLDVFATEPLPTDSPLWTMPNVIMTPHSAGASAGNELRSVKIFLDNVERWARKEPLLNLYS